MVTTLYGLHNSSVADSMEMQRFTTTTWMLKSAWHPTDLASAIVGASTLQRNYMSSPMVLHLAVLCQNNVTNAEKFDVNG